jgi:hypothetical protein
LRLSENAHLPAETAGSKELRLTASGGLPSSLVTAAYFYVRFIPRDFVPQQTLRDGHFPTASEETGFSTVSLSGFGVVAKNKRFLLFH